jgi:tyrosyl-tRNA synthetase
LDEGENPRDIKMWLAREIVTLYHSNDAAQKAEEAFVKTFQKKEVPDDVLEIRVAEHIHIVDCLVKAGLAPSKTDARRIIEQGGVKIDGEVVKDPQTEVKKGSLIQKGKRYFIRVIN